VPKWLENFCFDGFDASSGFGYWIHLSQAQLHPTLWREVLTVFFPDGSFGYWKGYGRSQPDVEGPSGPTVGVEVIVPFERLRIRCCSPLQRATLDELKAGPFGDRSEQLFEMDVEFSAAGPVWDMRSAMGEQIWATGHYEQGGRLSGSAGIGDEVLAIDGTGWRDHSLGPRDNTMMRQHVWSHAVFPSGRGFGLFQHSRRDAGTDLAGACTFTPSTIADARLVELTHLESNDPDAGFAPYRILLETENGTETIDATIQTSHVCTTAPPAMNSFGVWREGGHIRWESRTEFRWDDETAIGITERTMPFRP